MKIIHKIEYFIDSNFKQVVEIKKKQSKIYEGKLFIQSKDEVILVHELVSRFYLVRPAREFD